MDTQNDGGIYVETRLRTYEEHEGGPARMREPLNPLFSDLSEWVARFRRLNGDREGAA